MIAGKSTDIDRFTISCPLHSWRRVGHVLARVSLKWNRASDILGLLPPPLWGRAAVGGDAYSNAGASISCPHPQPLCTAHLWTE
jgi:hypothetical protein